jgi:hypothetical protein
MFTFPNLGIKYLPRLHSLFCQEDALSKLTVRRQYRAVHWLPIGRCCMHRLCLRLSLAPLQNPVSISFSNICSQIFANICSKIFAKIYSKISASICSKVCSVICSKIFLRTPFPIFLIRCLEAYLLDFWSLFLSAYSSVPSAHTFCVASNHKGCVKKIFPFLHAEEVYKSAVS